MRVIWELARTSFQRHLTYRAANWAGLITNIFFGLLRATVLIALYDARPVVAGMSVNDAITYTGVTQATIAYLSIFGWYDLMNTVYTGEIATDMLKPLGYVRYWLALDVGRAASAFLLRSLSIMIVYALFTTVSMPNTPLQWAGLAAAIVLSWFVSFAWRFLINLAAFWTPQARGIGRFMFGITLILSGFFMPFRFLPDWFVRFCYWTPFPSLVNTVVEIYLGLATGPDMIRLLAMQLAWGIGLLAIAWLIMQAGIRRLVIQGG